MIRPLDPLRGAGDPGGCPVGMALPVVKSNCPADGVTARKDTEELVRSWKKSSPDLRQKVLGAMQRAGLDGW